MINIDLFWEVLFVQIKRILNCIRIKEENTATTHGD